MTPARAMWLRLTLLGVVSGVMAGLVVLAFRAAIALGQFLLLPQGARGTYPGLDPWLRLLLPVAGGLLLGLIFDRLRAKHREVGIVHVLHHLHTPGKACLPAANLFTQLGGAVTAIIAGHAVDTEGPAVHIGAASASQLGRRLRVSAEEDHILAACGAAAAFNTPLAGIVFVVEVLRVRYEVSRFLPIIPGSAAGRRGGARPGPSARDGPDQAAGHGHGGGAAGSGWTDRTDPVHRRGGGVGPRHAVRYARAHGHGPACLLRHDRDGGHDGGKTSGHPWPP